MELRLCKCAILVVADQQFISLKVPERHAVQWQVAHVLK